MTRPLLLVTRPQQEARRTAAAAARAGFDSLRAPLLVIEALPWTMPEGAFEALLFTSARAPEFVAPLPGLLQLPAYAVGARTAEAATAAGFRVVSIGRTDATEAVALAAGQGVRRLLHPGGEDRTVFETPAGVGVTPVPVYAARLVPVLPPDALDALSRGAVFATMLFSARTARHFGELVDAAGIDRAGLALVVISPAVASAAAQGWARVAVASSPGIEGALAAARALWQGIPHG